MDQTPPHSTQSKFRCCEMCNETKPIDDFPAAGSSLQGVKYFRYKCRPCYSLFKYERAKRQQAKLIEYRKTLECKHCGNNDWRVIEFHHRDPSKKERAVSDMIGWSWEKIKKEMEKCDALCSNCHRILHYELREAKASGISSV